MMEHTELASGAAVAVIVSEIIEVLKGFKWMPLDWTTESLNRKIGVLVAFVTGLGLQFQFDPLSGQLIVGGLFISSLTHGVIQWATQQAYYRIAIKSKEIALPSNRQLQSQDQLP